MNNPNIPQACTKRAVNSLLLHTYPPAQDYCGLWPEVARMVDKDHTPVSETAPASGAIVFCKQKNTLVAVPFIGQMDGSSVEPHYKTGWRGAGILKKAGLDVELTPCEMNTVDKWSLFAWPLFENTTARKATATARFILLLDPNQNERPISPRIEAMKRLDKKIKRVATYILTKHGLVVPLKQP